MTPVSGTQSLELKTLSQADGSLLGKGRVNYPNNRLTVVVKEIAMPEASAVTIVEVPELEDISKDSIESHWIRERSLVERVETLWIVCRNAEGMKV